MGGIICPPPPDGVILRPPSSARVKSINTKNVFQSEKVFFVWPPKENNGRFCYRASSNKF